LFREFLKNNLRGILGTIIFHLTLFIIFMFVRIKEFRDDYEEYIVIDFQQSEPPKEKNFNIDLSEIIPELKVRNRSNIAVNETQEFKKQISTEEYLNELKKQYEIDQEDGWKEKLEEKYSIKNKDEGEDEFSNPNISPDETNIVVNINRKQRYIHIPVYKCKGSAIVKLNIAVDVRGFVVSTTVDQSETNTVDQCFIEEAVSSAKQSRFNTDYTAPARQKGTITYKFVAQ